MSGDSFCAPMVLPCKYVLGGGVGDRREILYILGYLYLSPHGAASGVTARTELLLVSAISPRFLLQLPNIRSATWIDSLDRHDMIAVIWVGILLKFLTFCRGSSTTMP